MSQLPLIADPATYRPCQWDLLEYPEYRDYWIELFRKHFPLLLEEAREDAADRGQDEQQTQQRCNDAQSQFFAYLDQVQANPQAYAPLDILTFCYERERVLRQHGFEDPYRLAKHRQNTAMLRELPALLQSLDALPDTERHESLIRGVFAGNIYDQGATETNALFQQGKQIIFSDILNQLRPRPWFVDHLDAWLERVKPENPAHRRALAFVDNAGPDIVLGMIPFTRDLLRRGTRVTLAANTTPSLNDVTIDELKVLIEQVAAFDSVIAKALQDQRLRVMGSGNGVPLIDLTKLDHVLVTDAAKDPYDLLILEGMGRAVESNFHVDFECETLKLAMIKDRGVAEAMNADLYDLVMRYDQP